MSTFSAKYHLILKTKGWWASQVVLMVKKPLANAGDIRDEGSVPGSGRSPGGGKGNPLQYSCLENPMDRGAWQTMVHRVAKSQTRLQRLSMHAFTQADDVTSLSPACSKLKREIKNRSFLPSGFGRINWNNA